MPSSVGVLIEIGSKRTFASAAAWPGWARGARDEEEALDAMFAYGSRFASAIEGTGVRFSAPQRLGSLDVVERVPGNATTDFGAPDAAFETDAAAIPASSWHRQRRVLGACWAAFDRSVIAAQGVELRKGPRGGGRELDAIVAHVVDAEVSYLRTLTGSGVRLDDDRWTSRGRERDAVLEGLDRARAGDLPSRGPRGGERWAPRRFLRRAAWHVLDHAWEIEDRAGG